MAPRHDDSGNGEKAAAVVRRAALWISPIVLATAIVVSYTINERRDLEDLREGYRRDVDEIRDKLDRLTRDLHDRLVFVDRDGIRDPVVRLAMDRHVTEVLQRMNVLTKAWARQLKDLNPQFVLPSE